MKQADGRFAVRAVKRMRNTLVGILGLAAVGCVDTAPSPANPLSAPPVSLSVSAADALKWNYRRDLASDLDGDGETETVILVADVEVSSASQPLWEDGHRWAVIVADGVEATLAYAAFVPHGFVEAAILGPSSDRRREILVIERTPAQLRALTIAYDAPGRSRGASAAHYQLESWLPGFARLCE